MAGRHVQVIASGAATAPAAASTASLVICADGGVAVAREAARRVDLVVGDLDSAHDEDLDEARIAGAEVERHPPTKDESDLELAMTAAVDRGATSLTVHLAEGGRLDHQLANLLVLASERWRTACVDAWVGTDRVWVVHDHLLLPLSVGDAVALQAIAGPARVTTVGLEFPLDDEVLGPTEARGIANRVFVMPAEIRVSAGVVLAISSQDQSAQAT